MEIINCDQSKFPIAERIVNDREAFLAVAKHRFGFIPQRGIDYFFGGLYCLSNGSHRTGLPK
jgi:hypothetical protein